MRESQDTGLLIVLGLFVAGAWLMPTRQARIGMMVLPMIIGVSLMLMAIGSDRGFQAKPFTWALALTLVTGLSLLREDEE